MLRKHFVAAIMLSLAARWSAGQKGIPTSVAAAEAEGAAFPRGAAPTFVSINFSHPFDGTAERKCVAPSATEGQSEQLRSGEILIRGQFVGEWGPEARRTNKFLWIPVHNPFEFPNALLLRAARIGHPEDAFRVAIADWGYEGRGHERESGFPSGVALPKAGSWMIIATAGDDWGCFLFSVATR